MLGGAAMIWPHAGQMDAFCTVIIEAAIAGQKAPLRLVPMHSPTTPDAQHHGGGKHGLGRVIHVQLSREQ